MSTTRRLVHEMRLRQQSSAGVRHADYRVLREVNRLLVLNCVREHGPLARTVIARRIGLSRTTVGTIIDALLLEGLVREGERLRAAPGGGRRAILVHFNADAARILGVDVGRTHLTLLLTNLAAEILTRWSIPFNADRGPQVCLPLLVDELQRFVAAHNVTWDQIIGVGVGIPGPLDEKRRTLVSPPRMPGWDGVNVREHLRRALPVPIYIDNDANMGALGECRQGAGQGVADLAYVKIGTGIGAGLVMGGHIYRGSHGSAGELGHITIDEDGLLCECGNRGCLETLAAAQAIVADACSGLSLAQERPLHDHGTHSSPALAERDQLDIADVVHAALEGDAASCAAIKHAGERIGVALASLVNLFNPSVILIDGSVTRAGELLLEPIRHAIATRSLTAASAHARVVAGALADNAIALGAVAAVLDDVFSLTSAT